LSKTGVPARAKENLMTRHLFSASLAVCAAAIVAVMPAPARAAQGAGAAAHWKGSIAVPDELQIEVDLVKQDAGWAGAITVPAQGLSGVPLTNVTVDGKAVSFVVSQIPGSPTFKGMLSDDGASLTGDFVHGDQSVPFKLARAGEGAIPPPQKSSPITKEIEGTWSGVLDAGGNMLRLTLKLASTPEGTSKGSLVSVDQGNAEVPIYAITQSGSHLELIVLAVAGKYSGDLKEGRLVGTWSQGPGQLPLEFARVP
jgi:hypothetical protein